MTGKLTGLFGLVMVATVAATGGACGGGGGGSLSGTVSCSVSESLADAGIALMICQEASGLSAQTEAQWRQSCSLSLGGTGTGVSGGAQFGNGPCPRDHAIGGCQISSGGSTVTNWYYDDGSGLQGPSDIQTLCGTIGATFIPA